MEPTVGRIVHYWENGSPCAAIIVDTAADKRFSAMKEGSVNLVVWSWTGVQKYLFNVKYNSSVIETKNGTWSWPARVAG